MRVSIDVVLKNGQTINIQEKLEAPKAIQALRDVNSALHDVNGVIRGPESGTNVLVIPVRSIDYVHYGMYDDSFNPLTIEEMNDLDESF